MKTLFTISLGLLFLIPFSSISQQEKTHFDNKAYVDGEFLVQLTTEGSLKELLNSAPAVYKLELVKELSRPMHIWLVRFDSHVNTHSAMQNWLYSQKNVALVDYNYYVQMRSTLPGDPSFTQQWHHNNTGQTGGTTDADIDSDLAWDITTGGTTATNDDIVVCIIESANLDHQDLTANRWFNSAEIENNSIDDDGNGYIDDYNGWNPVENNDNYGTGAHGTNCIGMMGARGDNGLNVVGANWDVKIMVVGDYDIGTQAAVVEAYTYPLVMRQRWNNSNGTEGAFVVATSASWGIDGADPNAYPIWCNFYDTLGFYGIINVGATTNSNLDVDVDGDMPTACNSPYMLGVGRTDHNDNTAGGYGDQTIEFGAPGIDVVTTAGTTGITTTTGTSFSCPLTCGVIGLAYSIPCAGFMDIVKANPKAGADLVLQALFAGVDQKPQLETRFITGGRLNSKNTIDQLMATTCSGSICFSPTAISAGTITETSAQISFTPADSAVSSTLFWRELGAATYTEIPNAVSPVALSSLTGCTDYEFYMRTNCSADSSNETGVQTFRTTECGNCIDLPYCSSEATNSTEEWIESFTLGTYTNVSGDNGGYEDFSLTGTIPVETYETYALTIVPDWSGTLYDEYSRIWIDYNQNGTFETTELVFDQGAATQLNATGSITIPATATLGITKMRVQMAYQGTGQTTLPAICGNFTYGEIEEYCLTIAEGSNSGLNEITSQQVGIQAYPNPLKNEVNFESTNSSIATIEIVDIVGKTITSKSVSLGIATFNTVAFQSGTYFYRVYDKSGNILFTEKLVKSN